MNIWTYLVQGIIETLKYQDILSKRLYALGQKNYKR